MRVLLLQQPSSTSPVDRWLHEADSSVMTCILTGVNAKRRESDLAPSTERVLVDDYYSAETDAELITVCERFEPDYIVSNSEYDVLRAAEARTLLGIPGMRSGLALSFRDKVRMKRLFQAAGLENVPHREVQCVDDVLAAMSLWGGTVVIKPRDGSGSEGVTMFETVRDVARACREAPGFARSLGEGRLMAERFVPGQLFHVDIAVRGQEALLVSISRYVALPHTFLHADVASAMVDAEDPDYARLRAAAESLVQSLPTGHGVNIMHLEMFKTDDGRFVAGEVASRLGGALIKDGIRHTYGADLSRLSYLLAVGLDGVQGPIERRGPLTGWFLWTSSTPPPEGTEMPPWVVEYFRTQRTAAPTYSGDAQALCLIEGARHDEIVQRMDAVRDWRAPDQV